MLKIILVYEGSECIKRIPVADEELLKTIIDELRWQGYDVAVVDGGLS